MALEIYFSVVLEILFRQRRLLVLGLPKDRNNPPTLTVVHQLNAVDAALKRLGVLWRVSRFIGAEGVCNLAKLFGLPRGLAFVKTFLFEKTTAALDMPRDSGVITVLTARLARPSGN